MKLRRFTRNDWREYLGCERFPDGSEPLRGDVTVDGRHATLVLDGAGFAVFFEDETGLATPPTMTLPEAHAMAAHLPEQLSSETLLAAGLRIFPES